MLRCTALALGGVFALTLAGCSEGGGGAGSASTAAAVSSAQPAQPTAPANLQTGPCMRVEPSGGFFAWPFPCDARRASGGGLDLAGFPNPRGEDFIDRNVALAETVQGFSPSGCIYLPFDGPITAPVDDPVLSTRTDSPVLLVAIDPASPAYLRPHPFHARLTTRTDSFRPEHLLQVLPVPGRSLEVSTRYALIVLRRLGAPGTAFLGQPQVLCDLLAGRTPAMPRGAELASAYQPLVAALRDLSIHPQDVAAATVFTTADPTAELVRYVARVDAQPPLPVSKPLEVRDVFPGYTALKGAFDAPQYQNGVAPFLWLGGELQVDAQGDPLAQGTTRAPFQLSIPKGGMPAAGFPLYLYCHGTGGVESQAIDRGRWPSPTVEPPLGSGLASVVAPEGWATACSAGLFSPTRLSFLAADGYLAYNFLHPIAMRDNFRQMVLEQVHFLNLLLSLRIDPALCPGTDASAASDGKVRFDPDRVVVGGQSLGSYLAGMLAATHPRFKAAVLTGAGGSWIEFAFGPVDPVDLTMVIELLALPFGERLDRFHPLVTAFSTGAGPADNTHYLRHILRDPLPGHTPPHVLVIEGHRDLQVSTNLQRALVLAIGLDFVGPDPGPTPDDQLLGVLPYANLAHLQYPVQGNRALPNGLRRTAVVVRYAEDGIREGHHVSTQLDEPKRQIAEFVRAVAAGAVPQVR